MRSLVALYCISEFYIHFSYYISVYYSVSVGRGSSVGIATRYRLDGPGIESRCVPYLPYSSIPVLGPIQSPIQWVPGLSRG